MNFSELFKQSGQLCQFSPDGQYLANAVQYRLIVRDVKTLQIMQLYTCLDSIQYIEWSSDSEFILCGMYKRGLVQVWSMEEPEWTCKIDEGSAGLAEVHWSPDGRHILTTSEFHLRITVWSLTSKSVSYIKYPKACVKGMDFSEGGKYLALAERRDCKDFISVFECASWHLVKHFETDTEDLAGIEWSPDGRVLCVWESSLQYKILLYSVDGRCLATYSAYEHALGAKCISWSPTGQFLAIGSYDQKVIYKEDVKRPPLLKGETEPPVGVVYSSQSRYEVIEEQVLVPVVKADPSKANPRIGVGIVSFSPDSRYFFTRNDNMPSALWIWDMPKLNQAAIMLQENSIKCVEWDPVQSRLALCTGNNKVYMWSPAGSLSVQVPTEGSFSVHKLKWHSSGDILLLMSKDQMCVCFLGSDSSSETT